MNKAEKDNEILQSKVSYLEKAMEQTPTLTFVKDENYVLIEFNDYYEKFVLSPLGFTSIDAINKNDFAIWDSATANKYRFVDSIVMACICPYPQDVTVPFKKDSIRFIGVKYPYFFEDGTIGSAGEFKVVINEK